MREELARVQLKGTQSEFMGTVPWLVAFACLIPPVTPLGIIMLLFLWNSSADRERHHKLLQAYFAISDAHLVAAGAGSPLTQYHQLIKVRNLLLADPKIGDAAKERWRSNYVLHLAHSTIHSSMRSPGQTPPPEILLQSFIDAATRVQTKGGKFLKREDLTAIFYALRNFYAGLPRAMQSPILPIGDLAAAITPSLRPAPIYCDRNRSPNLDLGLYLDLIFNFAMAYESQDDFLEPARLLVASQTLHQMANLPSLSGSLLRLHSPSVASSCKGQMKQAVHYSHAQMAAWIHSYQPSQDSLDRR